MKRIYFILIALICLTLYSQAQNNVGINDDNTTPKASAMLDVNSASKGMLIPRIALTATTTAAPVASPEASLLIFNTATVGDVFPGYYYWNGSSKWVRLWASTDMEKPFNTYVHSTSTTLLKIEDFTFASGNITLTLPVITSADNGLQIAVKNVGTYTDLITVVPQSGKKIDANTSSTLTRWRGRTYIAMDSNWIVESKETLADNFLEVSASGSFTSLAEVIAFLNLHMTGPTVVTLGGGSYDVAATQTINLPYPVTFQGISYGEATINATASGYPLFICQSECYFKMLNFNGFSTTSGNDAIRCTGSGEYYEVKDSYFHRFSKGIVSTTNNDIWAFEIDFDSCLVAGVEIAAGTASGGSIKVSECDFTKCGKGIHLLSGVAETVSVINSTFYNAATNIGLLYVPATFTSAVDMFITNNAWNNVGTYFSGFDFTLSSGRDANMYLLNNAGTENKNPHCKIGVQNNMATTTVATALTYYRANWVNTSFYTCKWTIGTTSPTNGNRITYQPNNLMDAWCIISGNLSVNDNKIITIAVVKNGVTATRYGETDLRIPNTNSAYQFSTVIYVPDMVPGDYLELYVTSSSNNDVVTFRDLQWFTNTQ